MKKLLVALLLLTSISCSKDEAQKAQSEGGTGVVSPTCGAIDMSPSNNLYPSTVVNFEVIPPTGITLSNLQWRIKKGSTEVFSSTNNTVSRAFNGAGEGPGSYTTTATFQKSDGNNCALEKVFTILVNDICVKPSGISGPTIGYLDEETSPFSLNAEPCFMGSVSWDMNNDNILEFTKQPDEMVTYTYAQGGSYTVRALVTDNEDNSQTELLHNIEIKYKSCINPFTNTAVLHGEAVEFAKTSQTCGGVSCEKTQRVCNNGQFGGDTSFTSNPATCAVSLECPATYAWLASEYGKCTGACESATGTRDIINYICKKTLSGTTTTVQDADCVTSIGAKPTGQTESCNVAVEDQNLNCLSCGSVPHNQSVTKWAKANACDTACTSQAKTCNNGVLPNFGAGYVYESQSSCPVEACPPVYTYTWITGEYGACSAIQCGTQGVRTRSVTCVRNDGTNVEDKFCSDAKPQTTMACSARPCNSCDLPWGGSIAHGATQTAYYKNEVACGETCASEVRACNDGILSGSATHESCSAEGCFAKGVSCQSFMGTMLTWKDSSTGQTCIGSVYGTLMEGDYTESGGVEYDPKNNSAVPWDKAKYKGSAKFKCEAQKVGGPLIKVISGTCTDKSFNLASEPVISNSAPADCSATGILQQKFGDAGKECAIYEQGLELDYPIKALTVSGTQKKFPQMGEYTRNYDHTKSSSKGKLYMGGAVRITYKGETKVLSATCGKSSSSNAKPNSVCADSESVTVGGVKFHMGVSAKLTIDPEGYVPAYIWNFTNDKKETVWSQQICGAVTLQSSLGYLPPPCE